MYHEFIDHTAKGREAERIEAENARLLDIYARKEENILRSTKKQGRMSTLDANKNIGAQVIRLGKLEAGVTESIAGRFSAQIEQASQTFSTS